MEYLVSQGVPLSYRRSGTVTPIPSGRTTWRKAGRKSSCRADPRRSDPVRADPVARSKEPVWYRRRIANSLWRQK